MYGHLVAVKVRIEGRTHQRMELDRLALYKDRLKGLNAETVQRRRTVEHHRMFLDDLLQNIPDLTLLLFHHLFGALDIVREAVFHQFLHDKGLEKLDRHLLGETALINLQFRSDDDNRTA